jgi:hypothetical protein
MDYLYIGKNHFLEGLCYGICEKFILFNEEIQSSILKFTSRESEFPFDNRLSIVLGIYLGSTFSDLDTRLRDKLLNIMNDTPQVTFTQYMLVGLGLNFSSISKEIQDRVLELIENRSELSQMGMYLSGTFLKLDKEMQEKILKLIEKKSEFKYMIFNLYDTIPHLDREMQEKILELAENQNEVAATLFSFDFSSLHPDVQEKVLKIMENRKGMLYMVIQLYIANHFSSLHEDFRKKVLELAGKSRTFGFGLGTQLRHQLDSLDRDH